MRIGRRPLSWTLSATALVAIATGAVLALTPASPAQAEDADSAEARERCSIRLSLSLLGESPDASLLAASNPQSRVDAMVGSEKFVNRFADFINSQLAGTPSPDANRDPVYFLAHHVLAENKPWSDLFIGKYDLIPTAGGIDIVDDPDGLGYFRSELWLKKYAGNDEEGALLIPAFRITQNTTGLELAASVGVPEEDRGEEGRKAPACRSCHYDSWYALDHVANLLPRRSGTGEDMVLIPPSGDAQVLLDGRNVSSDAEYVRALVSSDAWYFNQCRRVFKFLYGREENTCEAVVFDECVDTLRSTQDIKAAVATVAKDPTFCTN